jgi:hypothetical protein
MEPYRSPLNRRGDLRSTPVDHPSGPISERSGRLAKLTNPYAGVFRHDGENSTRTPPSRPLGGSGPRSCSAQRPTGAPCGSVENRPVVPSRQRRELVRQSPRFAPLSVPPCPAIAVFKPHLVAGARRLAPVCAPEVPSIPVFKPDPGQGAIFPFWAQTSDVLRRISPTHPLGGADRYLPQSRRRPAELTVNRLSRPSRWRQFAPLLVPPRLANRCVQAAPRAGGAKVGAPWRQLTALNPCVQARPGSGRASPFLGTGISRSGRNPATPRCHVRREDRRQSV